MYKVVLIGLLLTALYLLRDFVLVILTSIVIASFVEIVIKKLGKFGKYRTLWVVLIYLLSVIVFGILFYLFVPILFNETSNLFAALEGVIPESDFLSNIQEGAFGDAKAIVNSLTQSLSLSDFITNTQTFVSKLSGGFFRTLAVLFGGLINFSLIIVISFYLSIQERGVENFLRIVTPQKHEEYLIDLWRRTERKIALWIQGQMVLSVIIGVLIYLGLSILGVKLALLIAVIAAVFELIPFGMILAAIPAISFAFIDGGVSLALMVAGFYIIVQQFENYLFVPLIIKKVIGISPLVVILALVIGAQLAGFWGLILAIPVAVFIVEFLNDIEKGKKHQDHFPVRGTIAHK